MEAALVQRMKFHKKSLEKLDFEVVRGLEGIKTADSTSMD